MTAAETPVGLIISNVDLDVAYRDYTSAVKENGLNGFGKTAQVQIEPYFTASSAEPTVITADVTIKIGTDTYKGTLMKE